MMKSNALFLSVLLISITVHAQHPLVKITEIAGKGNAILLREVNADDAAPCIDVIKKTHDFKDVESVRFEQVMTGEKGYFEFDNGARTITFYLNAKNSYGAYAGPQKYECGISADGEIYVYP